MTTLERATLLIACGLSWPAHAYTVTITPGARAIYLQVGNGTYTGGNADRGGQPANNGTINKVSVTLAANSIGSGVTQAMTTDSTTTSSFIDGYVFCSVPAQVYIGGWARAPAGGGTAVLSVTTPAALNSGADGISFTQISWVASGNGDATSDIANGTFTGGTQTVTSFPVNDWREECFAFSYANASVPAAGTYTGRAVYTLSMP